MPATLGNVGSKNAALKNAALRNVALRNVALRNEGRRRVLGRWDMFNRLCAFAIAWVALANSLQDFVRSDTHGRIGDKACRSHDQSHPWLT